MATDLKALRAETKAMAEHLFEVAGIPFAETSELERQVIAAFAFGMVYASGRRNKLSPPQVHGLVLLCLGDAFGYADHQAAAFAEDLIAASSDKAHHATMNAIIHRGIDGHMHWERGDEDLLSRNLNDVLLTVGARRK
jgi:hypothetical protein